MRDELEHRPAIALLGGAVIGVTAIALPVNLLVFIGLLWVFRPLVCRGGLVLGFLVGLAIHPVPQAEMLVGKHWVQTVVHVDQPAKIGKYGCSALATMNGRDVILETALQQPPLKGESLKVGGLLSQAKGLDGSLMLILNAKTVTVERPPPIWDRFTNAWRSSLVALLDKSLVAGDRDFVMALCFGGHENLSGEEMKEAVDDGWIQLAAASGLQVLALVALLDGLGTLLPLPRLVLLVILTILLGLYALAAGLYAATARAVLVAVLARWAYVFKREPDLLSSVAVAGLVILLRKPQVVFELGFAMTMLVLSAFALFVPRSSRSEPEARKRWLRWFKAGLRTSFVATAVAIPLLAQVFHHVALKAFLSCFLVVVFVPVLVALTFFAQAASLVWYTCGVGLVDLLVKPLSMGLHQFFILLRPIDISFDVPFFSGYWLIPYYGLWLLTWRRFDRSR